MFASDLSMLSLLQPGTHPFEIAKSAPAYIISFNLHKIEILIMDLTIGNTAMPMSALWEACPLSCKRVWGGIVMLH